MTVSDLIPTLDDKELANLHANALRLQAGAGKRRDEAAVLIPLIEAEQAERIARTPPKRRAVRRAPAAAEAAAPAEAAPTESAHA